MFKHSFFQSKNKNKMASLFSASIYGANQNSWGNPLGSTMAFAPGTVVLRDISPVVSYSGVECAAQIQLLPTAPSPIQPVYYTDSTVAELVTAATTADS